MSDTPPQFKYFGAIIDGERVRLRKRKGADSERPRIDDVAGSSRLAQRATFIIDLDTNVVLKDRTGTITNFDDAPVYVPESPK